MSHYSYKSCEGTSKLFQVMFPDSRIVSQFSCGEKKCAYLICFGLEKKKKEEAYVLMFEESLNSVCYQSKWIFTFVHGIRTSTRLKVAIIPQCLWVMAQQTTCFLIFVQA